MQIYLRGFVYIVLSNEGRLGPDTWPKTSQQAKSTDNMMRTTWNARVMLQ